MSTKDELLTAFTNWERSTRKTRDEKIAAEADENKQRSIRQIFNIKISTIADAISGIKTLGNDEGKPVKLISISSKIKN